MLNASTTSVTEGTEDAAIPKIQVTEPVAEIRLDKKDNADSDEVLQMIINQQKAKRKKFIFRDKGEQGTLSSGSLSGSLDCDKGLVRGDSTDSEHSAASALNH
ncbi:hypothetical protein RvY_10999 [Ramazzottius varieornatus]|uniref:Uncharacterized protein n=1 Tax=Ramazzottius varieornatus TaxID=947166 RepID=A0A1D1VJ26_RAMVA|nr:hypothetical protein RvY_10999 [Ramazzottius varieornatus]